MKLIDIILLLLLTWGGYRGFEQGIFTYIFSSTAWVVVAISGMGLWNAAVTLHEKWFPHQPQLPPYVLAIVLFMLVFITIMLLSRLLKKILHATVLGIFDRILGAMWGVFKWAMYSSTLLYLTDIAAPLQIPQAYTQDAFILPMIASLAPKIFTWSTSWITDLEQLWLAAIEMLDRRRQIT